jgi:rRNA-processing protein FCF1
LRKVVFDSSFLIAVMEHPTSWQEDILEAVGGFEPVILESVDEELERLSRRGDKTAKFAGLAKGLVEEGRIKVEKYPKTSPDDDMMSYAGREHAAVATVDSALIRQLRALGIKVISLRAGRAALL